MTYKICPNFKINFHPFNIDDKKKKIRVKYLNISAKVYRHRYRRMKFSHAPKFEAEMRLNLLALECHARREFFVPKIAIVPQFQVYLSKDKIGRANNKFITSR